MYCLVVIDDYSRFTWVFFLAAKDETSGILKSFIIRIENLVDHKVKVIRCDNRTEFKNREMNQFCEINGIMRQFSVARTPQQNRVAERINKTLIKAARTMLVDSKLPTTFWAEAVNTAWIIVIRNKTRLVAQGYTQEEGIDYDEVFAHVAIIEAIRLFLAYASIKDFVVYQIDVKSDFLYGKIEEVVYVYQPPGIEDPDFPDRVYKVKKALYELHQAPRAWDEDGVEVDVHMYRYQVNPKVSHLHAVKRIFRKPTRKVTQVPQPSDSIEHVVDEAVYKELDDSLVRATTTSLEAEQDNGNIDKTQSKATPNESSSQGTNSGGGPRCQKATENTIAQTRFENVSKQSNDSLVARGNTLQSDEDRLKLNELMELCTNLQTRVLKLEKTKTTQGNEINSLKRRVKKLKKKQRSRTRKLKRLYKVGLTARVKSSRDEQNLGKDASKQKRRIDDIDDDKDITLVSVHDDADKEMFDADKDLGGEEVFVKQEVNDKEKIDEVTLAQALAELKTLKPKVKGVVIQEPSKSTTTTTFASKQRSQDKDKAKIIKEPVKPKKKEQIRLEEEVALRLQAEFNEEERLTRERDQKEQKANIDLIKT
nr:putative ribonuclease H-like domain-containing protein [Tanacetum cinerariifolium]